MFVQVTAKNVGGVFFETQCIYIYWKFVTAVFVDNQDAVTCVEELI